MIIDNFKSFKYKGNILANTVTKLAPNNATKIQKNRWNIWVIFRDNVNSHWLIAK